MSNFANDYIIKSLEQTKKKNIDFDIIIKRVNYFRYLRYNIHSTGMMLHLHWHYKCTHLYTNTVLDGSVILSVRPLQKLIYRCPISKLITYSASS